MAASMFDNFTHKYSLSKTLRFELVPTEKTKQLLTDNYIFEKDENIANAYKEIKIIFDDLHRKFVAEALRRDKIDQQTFDAFASTYRELRTSRKVNYKTLLSEKERIWRAIAECFANTGEDWRGKYAKDGIELKSKGHKVLTDASILKVLAQEYPEQKATIDLFDKFFTYFSGFNETRENFYKSDGTATAVASRIADNFVPFLENCKDFMTFYATNRKELEITDEATVLFKDSAYSGCLLQQDIEAYNATIGQLNKRMKMLRDSRQKDPDFKKSHHPLLRTLQNQILGERKRRQLFEKIEDESDAWNRLKELVPLAYQRLTGLRELFETLAKGAFAREDESGIYFTNKAINTLSRRYVTDWFDFEKGLPQRSGNKSTDDTKVAHFVSLAEIRASLDALTGETIFKDEEGLKNTGVIDGAHDRLSQLLSILSNEFAGLFKDGERAGEKVPGFDTAHEQMEALLSSGVKKVKDKNGRGLVKAYFDAGMPIYQMGKYFSLASNDKKGAEAPVQTNADFYNPYNEYVEDFNYAKQFDLFRNYISKKPGDDEEKVKLNFDSSVLLSGFDKNKESEKLGIILRDGESYLLGIIHKDHSKILDEKKHPQIFDVTDDVYEKMEYKLFPDPKRMIPKVAFAKGNLELLGCTEEILKIRSEFRKFQDEKKESSNNWSKKFDPVKLEKLIEYYQYALSKLGYQETFGFEFKKPAEYSSMGEFNNSIARQQYKVKFRTVSRKYINQCVDDGRLYVFKIQNKDLKNGSSGLRNIHTSYFLSLFSGQNLANPLLKLSGGAGVFLRRGKPHELLTRKDSKGKDVLASKRFAEDKTFLHIPILINSQSQAAPTPKRYNQEINRLLADHSDICVIGIDRGEKHLLYYSVIDGKGNVLEQRSMNELEIAGRKVNFYDKLLALEKERRENRRAWEPVRRIKDLKKGYVSHAVFQICQLIKEHNAIVVLEDLNMRFKQARGGIERSVYQQFEKALIDKLGYLTYKERESDAPGGVFHGYQLAAPFESFEKLNKQTGILFYTQADYTSVTDPLTGFRKNIYIKNSEKPDNIKKYFLEQKICIDWNDKTQGYIFTYDQVDFARSKKANVPSKRWTLNANVWRIKRAKIDGYWRYELVNPSDMLEQLFTVWGVQSPHTGLRDKLSEMEAGGVFAERREFDGQKRNFWQALIFILNLILQLRNSSSKVTKKNIKGELIAAQDDEVDFIASPVGPLLQTAFRWRGIDYPARFGGFEDRIMGDNQILSSFNGDANGAYNIARKGLIILNRIRDDIDADLFIASAQWDEFAQNQWNNT